MMDREGLGVGAGGGAGGGEYPGGGGMLTELVRLKATYQPRHLR